jgi:multiple sugar transport system permease protein
VTVQVAERTVLAPPGPAPSRPRPLQALWRPFDKRLGVLFLIPALLSFGVYTAYPAVKSLYLSLTNANYVTGAEPYVGLHNYSKALHDPLVGNGLMVAAEFTVLFYLGGLALPLVTALALGRVRQRGLGSLYRVLLYIPAVIPGPLIFQMWLWMYDPSTGLINSILVNRLHFMSSGPTWVANPKLAVLSVAIMEWWWGLGQMTVFLWVGLRTIPEELYEAARLDGASEFRITRHVRLPLLLPTLMTWAVLKVAAFAVIVEMIIFQGPGNSLMSWARYAWQTAFTGSYALGYAAAVGWIGAVVMVFISIGLVVLYRWTAIRSGLTFNREGAR